jgi:hypothetical protein
MKVLKIQKVKNVGKRNGCEGVMCYVVTRVLWGATVHDWPYFSGG